MPTNINLRLNYVGKNNPHSSIYRAPFKIITATHLIAVMIFTCQKYTTYSRIKNMLDCHSIVIFYLFDYFLKNC